MLRLSTAAAAAAALLFMAEASPDSDESSLVQLGVRARKVVAATDAGNGEEWVYCAAQFMSCECAGRIRWGNKDKWAELPLPSNATSQETRCMNEKLGDPAPGDAGKHCQCAVKPGTEFYTKRLNPAVIADPSKSAALKIASCDIFAKGQSDGVWGESQWRALRHFCQTPEGPEAKDMSPGPLAMDLATLRQMVDAWVDPTSVKNYKSLVDDKGWMEEAFINFVGMSPAGGKYAKMNEELIRSVHLFSTRPIVVVHFGMVAPPDWDASKYPRLVLLHAAPLPADPYRHFDFNKYRAMLVSRVRTGVVLDSDQFVAPGVDRLFRRAAEETTEDYPLPIMPVHFMKNTDLFMYPKKGKKGFRMSSGVSEVFTRFCTSFGSNTTEAECPGVTTRWGHAHPTYTHYALPHLGKWLRRHFRDETMPDRPGRPGTSFRVIEIDVDEDLLNMGIWDEGGYKQWCKFDVPDPTDFDELLRANEKTVCDDSDSNIGPDFFYPEGAARAYYTAHHAVQANVSAMYIDKLAARMANGTLPPAIKYKKCWYKDQESMLKAHPKQSCLI